MRIDWHTVVLQAVNFAILVWLLQHFLYRPVLRMVDTRRAQIDEQYGAARKAEAEARDHLAAADARRAALDAERAQLLKAAATEADKAATVRRAAAEREAAALLDEARKSLAAESRQALDAARQAALDLAAALARRLLREFPQSLRTQAWLDRICEYLAELPPERRDALAGQLSPAVPLDVVTAEALAPHSTENWRRTLAGALGGCAVSFGVDAALGAGVELHFPAANLCFSLRSTMQALRAELERPAGGSEAPPS